MSHPEDLAMDRAAVEPQPLEPRIVSDVHRAMAEGLERATGVELAGDAATEAVIQVTNPAFRGSYRVIAERIQSLWFDQSAETYPIVFVHMQAEDLPSSSRSTFTAIGVVPLAKGQKAIEACRYKFLPGIGVAERTYIWQVMPDEQFDQLPVLELAKYIRWGFDADSPTMYLGAHVEAWDSELTTEPVSEYEAETIRKFVRAKLP